MDSIDLLTLKKIRPTNKLRKRPKLERKRQGRARILCRSLHRTKTALKNSKMKASRSQDHRKNKIWLRIENQAHRECQADLRQRKNNQTPSLFQKSR